MRVALLSDIHGNALALEAVLRELAREPVDAVMNLGDIFYGPLWPRRTWALLRDAGALTIHGNQDRDLIDAFDGVIAMNPTLRHDLDELASERGDEPLHWLRTLPATLDHHDIHACHGTPASDLIYLLEDISSGDAVLRPQAQIHTLLDGIGARVIVCGHTHTPRAVRLEDGRLVVNPGSVGLPAYDDELPQPHRMQTGTPQARWAIIEKREQHWHAQLRASNYDHEAAAQQAAAQGRADWAQWLRTGRADLPAPTPTSPC